MPTAGRLAAFAAVLTAVFALAFGLGRAVGPGDTAPTAPGHAEHESSGERR